MFKMMGFLLLIIIYKYKPVGSGFYQGVIRGF